MCSDFSGLSCMKPVFYTLSLFLALSLTLLFVPSPSLVLSLFLYLFLSHYPSLFVSVIPLGCTMADLSLSSHVTLKLRHCLLHRHADEQDHSCCCSEVLISSIKQTAVIRRPIRQPSLPPSPSLIHHNLSQDPLHIIYILDMYSLMF